MIRFAAHATVILAFALAFASACFDPFYYGTRAGGDEVPDQVTWAGDVYPLLLIRCASCHEPGGSAADTALSLTSDAGADFAMIMSLVVAGAPEQSALLQKASGNTAHAGGALLPETSADYLILQEWVQQGAVQ